MIDTATLLAQYDRAVKDWPGSTNGKDQGFTEVYLFAVASRETNMRNILATTAMVSGSSSVTIAPGRT